MTPKETSEYLINKFSIIPINMGFPYKDAIELRKQCALIAVDEILETTKVKWATQRKLPNGEWRLWKGISYKNYWVKVKQEIEKL